MSNSTQSSTDDDETSRLLNLHLRNRNCRAIVPVKKPVVQPPERESPSKKLLRLRSSLRTLNAVAEAGDPMSIVEKLRQANQLCAQLQQSASHVDEVLRTLAAKVQEPDTFNDTPRSSSPSPPSQWSMVGQFKSCDTFESDHSHDDDSVDPSASLAAAVDEISRQDEIYEKDREVAEAEVDLEEEDDDESYSLPETRVGIARADYGMSQRGRRRGSPHNLMINTSPNQWKPLGSKESRRTKMPEMKSMQFGLASISERLFDPPADQDI